MREKRDANRVLVGKHAGIRPLRRPRRTWEGNIKMNFEKVEWVGTGWINLAQVRDRRQADENAVMNVWVSLNAGNFLTS
jgi:hypothetical protein